MYVFQGPLRSFTVLPLTVKLERYSRSIRSNPGDRDPEGSGSGRGREILKWSFQDQLAVVKDNRFTVGLFF